MVLLGTHTFPYTLSVLTAHEQLTIFLLEPVEDIKNTQALMKQPRYSSFSNLFKGCCGTNRYPKVHVNFYLLQVIIIS